MSIYRAEHFKALIFDFDGIICDSEMGIYRAWQWLYASEGEDLTVEDYARTVGGTAASAIEALEVELERRIGALIDWDRKLPEKDRLIEEYHRDLRPLPGVAKLLNEARVCSIPCVIATSLTQQTLSERLRKTGLEDYFTGCGTSEMVERPKPAPDVYLFAAMLIGVAPSDCIAFEDSHKGLCAAIRAGCRCIAVPTMITRHQDFGGAVAILNSLEGVDISFLDRLGQGIETPSRGA